MSKIGPRERALREAREARCRIDHKEEGAIPKDLCVLCTPRPKHNGSGSAAADEKPRDFRIPKGHTIEEGEALLARLSAARTERNKRALEAMAEKQRTEFAHINTLRGRNGLQPLPEKFVRLMKADRDRNIKLFLRAAENGECAMNTTAKVIEATKKAPKLPPERPRAHARLAQLGAAAREALQDSKKGKAAKAPQKATGATKAKEASSPSPKGKKPSGEARSGRRGAFNPETTALVMGLLKKGATAKAIIAAAKWSDCPNPLKRVQRFITTVAEDDLKTKVTIEGRGEEAVYTAK